MSDDSEIIWSAERKTQELTDDERIALVEEQAEKNCAEREENDKEWLAKLRRDRENADSRESWQNTPKEAKTIAGERTKAMRSFAMPHSTIFNTRGKTNAFKTEDKMRRLERFLNKHTRVSTNERRAYLGALECFKKRDGSLNIVGVKKMNKLIRTGETGGDRDIKKAVYLMKEKGIIGDAKDMKRLIGRGAVRKMREAMTRRPDAIVPIKTRSAENPRIEMRGRNASSSSKRP